MRPSFLPAFFRLDAAANIVGGLALVAFAGTLAAPFGVPAWMMVVAAAGLVANGVWLARVAGRLPADRTSARIAAAIDLGFAASLLTVAVVGLPGAETWTRWVLAAVGDVTVLVGIVKLFGSRAQRVRTARVAAS